MKQLYKVIKNLIPTDECDRMARRLEYLLTNNIYRQPDPLCQNSPAFYGIFNDELMKYQNKLEIEAEEELLPVYTYARIYQENELMTPHTDRPGAEISVTITLDYDKYIWPIYIQKNNTEFEEIILDRGDGLLYQGSIAAHMRHPMVDQEFQHQTFFHYVRKNGIYAKLANDERNKLLTNKEAEAWNFPEWDDIKYQEDPQGFINRFITKD